MSRCTLVVTGAPLALRSMDLTSALLRQGLEVDYVITEAAQAWISDAELEGMDVHSRMSKPGGAAPRVPLPDVVLVCPATFNTINKLAAGVADTHAHSFLCECIGAGIPMLLVPVINERLWNHRVLQPNLRWLETAGCVLADPASLEQSVKPISSGQGKSIFDAFDVEAVARLTTQLAAAS